jgi:type VI secretion system secreted protein Hcp
MALNAYLTCTGAKQGAFTGSVTQKGRVGSIMVFYVENEIESPRDAASGLPTGKRMHKPLVIYKEVDQASPLLWNALCNNETITKWQLQFWRPSMSTQGGAGAGATENQFYTIDLTNSTVCKMEMVMENNKDEGTMRFPEYEKVSFVYQAITWTWTKGGITASDDWENPQTSN